MTKEEVNKLYLKVITEYGIKDHAEIVLSNTLMSSPDISEADKAIVISKLCETPRGVSLVLNNATSKLDYARVVTADHIFSLLLICVDQDKKNEFFSFYDTSSCFEILNRFIDHDTGKVRQDVIETLEQMEIEAKEEKEKWEKVKRGEIPIEGIVSRVEGGFTVNPSGLLFIDEDDEEGWF